MPTLDYCGHFKDLATSGCSLFKFEATHTTSFVVLRRVGGVTPSPHSALDSGTNVRHVTKLQVQ